MNMRVLFLLAMMAPLAACTTASPDPFLTASVGASAPAIATEVAPEFAAARLPATAGPARLVRQTVRESGLEQVVIYQSPTEVAGENGLTIRAGKGSGFRRPPTRGEIGAEMHAALPGVAMEIRPVLAENAHGPFGYATGRFGSSGTCIYAWQLVASGEGGPSLLSGASALRQQIRLRFCRSGATEESLVGLMRGLMARPVTKETLSMLRFAGGNGTAALPVPAEVRDQPARAVVTVRKAAEDEPVETGTVDLPIRRHGAAPLQQTATGVASSAAPVPLPSADADKPAPHARTAVIRAAPVPMPDLSTSN